MKRARAFSRSKRKTASFAHCVKPAPNTPDAPIPHREVRHETRERVSWSKRKTASFAQRVEKAQGCAFSTIMTQYRSSSGNGTAPPCTCIPPISEQRDSVGTALPGFSSPCGSNTARSRWNCASSASLNWLHIWSTFSMPTPCSPVMVPPAATHSSRIFAPQASARCSWSSSLAS